MSKKILSFVLILAIMMSTVIFTGMGANAEEAVSWKVGDQPFAVEGGRQDPVLIKAADGEFYDDFIIPTGLNFDGFKFSDTALTSSNNLIFQLNQGANNRKNEDHMTVYGNSGTEYIWMYISEEDENGDNPNAYGGKGTSIKITNTSTKGTTRIDRDGKSVYTNAVRTYDTINCSSYPSLNDIAFSFWVKTTGPATFSMAFYVKDVPNNTDFARKLYTDPVNITEAGEYIITFPIQSFYIGGASFPEIDISTLMIQRPEIFFATTSTVDFYIDNFGVYPIMPNFGKATHSRGAYIKDDFESYEDSTTTAKTVTNSAGYTWAPGNSAASAFFVGDHDGGKALYYQTTNYINLARGTTLTSSNCNSFGESANSYVIRLNLDNTNVNVLGSNATIAIWVKASRASRIVVKTNNNAQSAWVGSDEIRIPAGESIIKVPVSKLIEQDSKFIYFRKLNIFFTADSPVTGSLGGKNGYFIIDDIAIEPTVVEGDVNGDKLCDLLDAFRLRKIVTGAATTKDKTAIDFYGDEKLDLRDDTVLRGYLLGQIANAHITPALRTEESFAEKTNFVMGSWKMSAAAPAINKDKDFKLLENSPFYYTGTNDTKAYEVKYSSLTTTGNAFFYDGNISTNYGSDSVLSFWVYTDQSVNLTCQYMDRDTTDKLTQCKGKIITVPAGESIVSIPMSECLPTDKEMKYVTAYQFLIAIRENSSSTKTDGKIYIDSIGFYDKDTTNDIGYIPAVTE